jgi:hypothetical protein
MNDGYIEYNLQQLCQNFNIAFGPNLTEHRMQAFIQN